MTGIVAAEILLDLVQLGMLPSLIDGRAISLQTRLDDAAPSAFDRYVLLVWAEEQCSEEFPAELLDVVETIDDFLHYYGLKLERSR
jgi:hypothetical protein